MYPNQLSWSQAVAIYESAAEYAMGFSPRAGSVTVTVEEIRRVAEASAHKALILAGCLSRDDERDQRANDQLASAANARHDAWKRKASRAC